MYRPRVLSTQEGRSGNLQREKDGADGGDTDGAPKGGSGEERVRRDGSPSRLGRSVPKTEVTSSPLLCLGVPVLTGPATATYGPVVRVHVVHRSLTTFMSAKGHLLNYLELQPFPEPSHSPETPDFKTTLDFPVVFRKYTD